MREIKFRAWLKDCETKKPYGLYFDLESISQGSIMARDGEWHYLVNLKHTTEQFTGLCDKNGREIYEGDIIRDSTFKERGSYVMRVEWEPEAASFVLTRKGWAFRHYFMESSDPKDCEVIGNIHENPELLG